MAKIEFTSEQLYQMVEELLENSQQITQAYNKIIESIRPCVEQIRVSEETYLMYNRIAVKNKEVLDRIIRETKEMSEWIRLSAQACEEISEMNVEKFDPSKWK